MIYYSMTIDWSYNKNLDTYLFGEQSRGGGVFKDNNSWYGNSVVFDDIIMFGPYPTIEEAKKAVENDFTTRIARLT